MTGLQSDVYQSVTLTSRPNSAVSIPPVKAGTCQASLATVGRLLYSLRFGGIWRDMRNWRLILLVLVAGGAVAYFGPGRGLLTSAAPTGARAPAPAIPVMASKAERTDIPIELAGLGTVQALNSVLVRSRVDGQIVKINYSEGKDVHAGDVLVEIDPAPFEAALAQAQANKLKDQAQLDNARLDLDRVGPAGQVRGDQHPAARYPESPGGAARRQREGRSGRDRHGAGAARLQPHPLADRRPRRNPAGRCRQYRARDRPRPASSPSTRSIPSSWTLRCRPIRCRGSGPD